MNGVLTFDRELRGLRNTILLPEGWEVTSVRSPAPSECIGAARTLR